MPDQVPISVPDGAAAERVGGDGAGAVRHTGP